MASLIAKSPLAGLGLPFAAAGCTLSESLPGPIHSIAPFSGQDKALAKALKPLGLAFPAPGGISAKGHARLVWAGRGTAYLMGAEPPPLDGIAAVTDQSDGWACLTLSGDRACDVLARLVALDLRAQAFAPGTSARVLLNHMQALLIREGETRFAVLVFRSMARTAMHEITEAMQALAARP